MKALVVGAGPTGLTMACELARHGVACRIVDQAEAPATTSRAIAVQSRTLEVFDDLGVAAQAIARGKKLQGVNAWSDGYRLAHFDFRPLDAPYPYILILPQADTEALLADHARGFDLTVERGKQLTGLTQDEDGVEVTFAHERARFDWVIGCDGAHSTVRHALALPFEGEAYEERFLLADVAIAGVPDLEESHAWLSADGIFLVLPLPQAGRARIVANNAPTPSPAFGDVEAVATRRGPAGLTLSEPSWVAGFSIHRRIVPRYRVGRVFLAGDAAHIHSPVGGQGMNTGIQDAYNLAWKLGLCARGAGVPSLLDSYEAERRPIAAATLQATDLATRIVTLRDHFSQDVRNTLISLLSGLTFVQKRVARTASMLDLDYPKSPIVAEHRASLLELEIFPDRTQETPSVPDHIAFAQAPAAGERAPDARLADGRRLFDLYRGPHHTLLLFDGTAPTARGYGKLGDLAQSVRARNPGDIRPYILVHGDRRPTGLRDDVVLFDPEGTVHARFGAPAECLYLIRPDGHIAYRCQPADGERLTAYLRTIFA